MNFLLKNFSNLKARVQDLATKTKVSNYSFFTLVVGQVLTQTQDVDKTICILEEAFVLHQEGKLPDMLFYQLLSYIYENVEKFGQVEDFLRELRVNSEFDLISEIEALFEDRPRRNRRIQPQNRCNSIDTVVMADENHTEELNSNPSKRKSIEGDFEDFQMSKKMKQDEELALKMQQEEEQQAKKAQRVDEETLCEICYVDLYENDFSLLEKCSHVFHKDCMIESFKAQISANNFPLQCPNEECKMEALETDIKAILPETLFKKYQDHTLKAYADQHGDSVSWCPTADCGYMFFHEEGDEVRFECLECKKQYCLNCRCEWHKDMTCKQYKINNSMSEDDQKFMDFVKGKKYKQCPKCKFWVERTEGCDHMTCKCKFEFCYKCGGVYMKCECMAKQRELMEQRRRQAEQRRLKRQEAKKRKAEKLKAEPKSKRGGARSTRSSKKDQI